MKKSISKVVAVLCACIVCTVAALAQEDAVLKNIEKHLRDGDCISAETAYNAWKEQREKSAIIELRISECKNRVLKSVHGDITVTVKGYSFTMIGIEGGSFTMGCTSEQGSDCDSDEKPAHSVTLSSYRIGKYEVTQGLWKAVMGSNPSYFTGDNLPVEQVSWEDAMEFIRSLNFHTNKEFRLPTEAEWEYAARGGDRSNGTEYSGAYSNPDNAGWYSGNSDRKTHPVGTKRPNELGIYDMTGNVWEWCSDWFNGYSSSSQTNPKGVSSGYYRVIRGGSWSNDASDCRVAIRHYSAPGYRSGGVGFRLVLP
ncbi:MAG: formylglycine-generating enzyme family protein [Bacteroidales bacterium]|jgi:formylglycine-generating enzyme required for sulfatase activity|nr:formylglycine-generating enzyme family protein [Bacteroidales bacterium]